MIDYTYIIIVFIIFILSIAVSYFRSKKLLLITLTVICLVSSFRFNLGGDYPAYYYIFHDIGNGAIPPLYYTEPLFVLLNIIVYSLGLHFNVILFISSALLMYSVYMLMLYLDRKYWFIFLCIFIVSYNAYWSMLIYTRQEISTAFIVMAFISLHKGLRYKATLLLITASLFHNPAIILSIGLFFNKRINLSSYVFLLIIAIVFSLCIPFILHSLPSSHYTYYSNLSSPVAAMLTISFFSKLFVFLISLFILKRYKGDLLYNLFLLSQIVFIASSFFSPLFRVNTYFSLFYIFGLCMVFRYIANRFSAVFSIMLVCINLLYNGLSLNKIIVNKHDHYYWQGYNNIFTADSDLHYFSDRIEYNTAHGVESIF
ncbi:EpsG family protein [Vibrio breoganii]